MRNNGRGDRSQSTASAGGSSSSDVTRWPATTSPPSVRKCATRASVSFCAPPRGITHPTMCAMAPSTSPKPAVSGRSSGTIPCAAMPPNNARVRSSTNVLRASASAERSASSPNPASANGCRGHRNGPSTDDSICGQLRARLPNRRAYACSSRPSRAAVRSIERSTTAAVPSSNGCATMADGWIHSRPCFSSGSVRRNGEATAVA